MSIKVVHCHYDDYDIYIGRGTILGNPFIIGKDGNRNEVLNKYRLYAQNNKDILKSLPTLKNKILGCWCKPKKCHGDILKEMVEGTGILTI